LVQIFFWPNYKLAFTFFHYSPTLQFKPML
jgi:hypothetical protein